MDKYTRRKQARAKLEGKDFVPPEPSRGLRQWKRDRAKAARDNAELGKHVEFVNDIPYAIKVFGVLLGIVFVWFYTEFLRAGIGYLSDFWSFAANSLRQDTAAAAVALCVGFFGYVLFEFRQRARIYYALLEFVVALLVTTEACLRTSDPGALAAALASSVYIVVRAFDNAEKGWGEL